jgi:hypothetical protein
MLFLKAGGIVGSVLVLIALAIAFLKSAIAFIGLLAFAVKVLIVVAFIAVFLGVIFLIFSGKRSKTSKTS